MDVALRELDPATEYTFGHTQVTARPRPGESLLQPVIESVKAAGEVKSPLSGVVVAVNDALVDSPEKVNDDPAGEGWIFKINSGDISQLENLMDDAAYKSLLESLA